MRQRFSGLWRHANFMKLWVGQTISLFGSHIGGGALRYTAILFLGATPLQLGLLSAAAMAPALLLGLVAGVWVDRLRRRPVLVMADIGRAVLLLSIPAAYLLGVLRIEQLFVVAALTGALTMIFDLAYQSFLPSVVRRDHLVEGNSKLGVSDSVSEIAGPPLGGALVQFVSAPFAVALDALSFLGSALAIRRVRVVEVLPEVVAQPDLLAEAREGLRTVWRSPVLRALLCAAVTRGLFGNIIGALYDLYLIRELGLSPAMVGLTVGVGGVSALVGALIAERFIRRVGIGPAMLGSSVIGLSGMLIPLAHGSSALALSMIMLAQATDIAFAIYSINEMSLRQAVTPERLLGRVGSCFSLLLNGSGLIGAVLGGALGATIGARAAIAIGIGGVVLSGLWVYFSPIRRLRAAPTPDAQHHGAAPLPR